MATFTYIPEGNLRLGFSGTAESLGNISRSFDYNVESINPFTAQDFTFGGAGLSAVTSTEDYGLVTDDNGPTDDLGEVAQYASSTLVPFGSVLSVLQSETQEFNIHAVDFVTGTRDTGVGISTTLQLKDYCNAIGSGNGVTGKYGTLDDTAFAYVDSSAGLDWVNYILSNASDGDHHYINFDSGVAQQWTSEYVYKGQITDFNQLTESYTWAVFVNINGESGALFKLPDYVADSTSGDLGNINLSRASLKVPETTLSGQDGTLFFIPSLAGTGLFNIITGFSPEESYPWLPEPGVGRTFAFAKGNYSGSGSLYGLNGAAESFTASYNESSIKIFTETDIGSITQPPVQDDPDFGDWGYVAAQTEGQLDFEQLVGFGFTESVYPLAGTGSTNPLSYGVALTLSGAAPTREIQVYGINPGDHLYPQPLDVSSGIITVSGTPLVHPFVDYTPHYGIEKNIGIGTYAFRLSDTADADKINDYVGSGNIPLLSGAAESITKVYDEYDVVIVDEISYDGILDTVPYNGYEDWGQITELYTPSETWGPIIGFGSFIPSFPAQTTYPFGLFNIVNGLSPQESYPWLPEPGVGRSWSFSKGLYTASGGISIVGVGTEVVYYEPLKVYGVDFVTGWVDSGVDSDNWTDQFRFYCNYTGFGNPVNGQYITNNNYALAYVAGAAGQTLLNEFITNATEGQRDYVNFGSGPAAKWSSAYKLSTTVVTDLTQIVDEYSYAPFQINGQAGLAFKLPDYVPFGTGSLGNINKLYESFRISGELNHPDIDLTPHYGIEKNIGIGTTGIQIGGISAGIERVIFNPPENTQLFEFVGIVTAEKRVVFNPPENIQLFESSGYITEKVAFNYVGIGSIPVTGTAIEKVRFDTPDNTQLFDVSGIGSTKEIQVYGINPGNHLYPQPEDFSGGLITIYGELNHPDIDYTPHYGIEKNIGIGTTGIQFKVGIGTNPDSEGRTRDARTYSNRYPINDKVPGTGIGTFLFDQINDTAKYGVLTPYAGLGTFYVSTGFSPEESYPWLPEPGVGRSWSYTRSTYITSGTLFTPASAITQEINVYTFNTTPDVGVLTLSDTFVERASNSYVGSGSYVFGRSRLHFDSNGQTFDQLYPTFDVDRSVEFIEYGAYYTETDAYAGSGTIRGLSGTAEAFSAQTPEETQLFRVLGSANEAYSAQTPELQVLYSIQGSDTEESSTVALVGITAQIIVNGIAVVQFEPNYAGRGTIRFVTHTTDNDYDTCDQEIFTTDYNSNANYSFTVNAEEDTILFNFAGSADSTPSGLDIYEGVSTDITISGGVSDFKRTFGYSGSGTILATSTSENAETEIYTGSGSITASGYSTENFTAQPTEDTVTYTVSGTASTEIDQVYPVSGVGLFNLSSSAQTREIAVFSKIGDVLLASITLSGELVFPDVRFIPSPETGGDIYILGDADKILSKNYKSSEGTLFKFGGGFESFTKSTYTGIGTVYFETQSATTTNNPFEIPRTYVVII